MIDKGEFNLKDHEFEESTFMGGWITNHSVIDDMWSYFKQNESSHEQGKTIKGDNPNTPIIDKDKISTELSCSSRANHYPVKKYLQLLDDCIKYYSIKYEAANTLLEPYNIVEDFNIQYYKPNEGFKNWHCERGAITVNRVFVFMTYLNDVEDGGTEFKYQKFTCPAKKGLTIIWPAGWEFTHKGQVSQSSEKYIITGWWNTVMNNE